MIEFEPLSQLQGPWVFPRSFFRLCVFPCLYNTLRVSRSYAIDNSGIFATHDGFDTPRNMHCPRVSLTPTYRVTIPRGGSSHGHVFEIRLAGALESNARDTVLIYVPQLVSSARLPASDGVLKQLRRLGDRQPVVASVASLASSSSSRRNVVSRSSCVVRQYLASCPKPACRPCLA